MLRREIELQKRGGAMPVRTRLPMNRVRGNSLASSFDSLRELAGLGLVRPPPKKHSSTKYAGYASGDAAI